MIAVVLPSRLYDFLCDSEGVDTDSPSDFAHVLRHADLVDNRSWHLHLTSEDAMSFLHHLLPLCIDAWRTSLNEEDIQLCRQAQHVLHQRGIYDYS